MSITRTTEPAIEPVTVEEGKAHLRVTGNAEDSYIAGKIRDARIFVENYTRRSLITQEWEANFDGFPCSRVITLERSPLQEITSFTYKDADLVSHDVNEDSYLISTKKTPAQIVLRSAFYWPPTAFEIEVVTVQYRAGYGDSPKSIPGPLIDGILYMLGHFYANREPVITGTRAQVVEIPQTLSTMLEPYVINS